MKDDDVKNTESFSRNPTLQNTSGRAWRIRIVLFFACAFLGFLMISQYKSLIKTPEEKFVEGKTSDELALDYMSLYNKNIALADRNRALTENASKLEAASRNDKDLTSVLTEEDQDALRRAGLMEASGSGISVVIHPDKDVPITSNMLIQFINEVKAADASAISINNQRVVAMTEVRDTVLGFSVNGVTFYYDNPITIVALGNGVDMYGALQMIGGVLDKWTQDHIDVHVDIVDNLTVPALADWQADAMSLLPYADTLTPTTAP